MTFKCSFNFDDEFSYFLCRKRTFHTFQFSINSKKNGKGQWMGAPRHHNDCDSLTNFFFLLHRLASGRRRYWFFAAVTSRRRCKRKLKWLCVSSVCTEKWAHGRFIVNVYRLRNSTERTILRNMWMNASQMCKSNTMNHAVSRRCSI